MTLKVDAATLEQMEQSHPGLRDTIAEIEREKLPRCPNCDSTDTAFVQVGLTGRTIDLAAATTRVKLLPNRTSPAEYYCNHCQRLFG